MGGRALLQGIFPTLGSNPCLLCLLYGQVVSVPRMPLFIAALFTIAKIWKQRKWPSTDKWIKKSWGIYTMEYHSRHKKEWKFAICNQMDGLWRYYVQWNKLAQGYIIQHREYSQYFYNLKWSITYKIFETLFVHLKLYNIVNQLKKYLPPSSMVAAQIIKNRITVWATNSISGYILKWIKRGALRIYSTLTVLFTSS